MRRAKRSPPSLVPLAFLPQAKGEGRDSAHLKIWTDERAVSLGFRDGRGRERALAYPLCRRVPLPGSSVLITSAPNSAMRVPQKGPAHDLRELENADAGQGQHTVGHGERKDISRQVDLLASGGRGQGGAWR